MINKITIEVPLKDLMEVLNATKNPEVAAAILNGTYQEPEFDKSDRVSKPDKEGERLQYKYVSYNKWTDEVTYNAPGSWDRTMPLTVWLKLELWEHVMDSQAHALAE